MHIEELPHTEVFSQWNFYIKELLHTDAFAHRNFYTQKFLHEKNKKHNYTQRSRYTEETFTQRNLHSEEFLHAETFTQKKNYTEEFLHTEALTHRSLLHREHHRNLCTESLYTEKFLHTDTFTHTETFTQRSLDTQVPLHRQVFTQRNFYTFTETFTQRIRTNKLTFSWWVELANQFWLVVRLGPQRFSCWTALQRLGQCSRWWIHPGIHQSTAVFQWDTWWSMNPWRIEVPCNTMFIRSHGVNGQKSKRLLGVWQVCQSEVTLKYLK